MTLESPLKQEHLALGGRLTEFGGWNMPLQYSSVIAEHRAVREAVGVFDVSHLGKLWVGGDRAPAALDSLLPGRVAVLQPGQAGYNLVLNDRAGIIDDVFVYRMKDGVMVVPNASNTAAVHESLRKALSPEVSIRDDGKRLAIIALSGPQARNLIEPHAPDLRGLKLHRFTETEIAGSAAMVARTGYTGEFTYEFFVPWEEAPRTWRWLLERAGSVGGTAAGLGARDTLRLEMGYPLHGHEIDETTNPVEAGLGWAIDWDKEFPQKPVLEQIKAAEPTRKLVGLVARGREIPRTGYPVLHEGREVGRLTSGNISPTLGKGVAMAYVPPRLGEPGTMLTVDVRGKPLEVEVTKPPFIERPR